MAGYSLILIGGPGENLVAQKLRDRLPLIVLADGRCAGGQQGETECRVRVIASGVFDRRWRLREELLVTR